jgi:ribosomal protein S18 acetylase RimI-like enzyme
MSTEIRNITAKDLTGIKAILDSSELFPSEYLDDMIADYLNNPASEEIWFCKIENDIPVGFGFCAPEKMTKGTFNLYAIAVRRELQGHGIGSELMAHIENVLKEAHHRILIVDTSNDSAFDLTRQFYLNLDYQKAATIPEFWSEGEDKVVFWKKL